MRTREQVVQRALCGYIKTRHPNVIFASDFAAGVKLPPYLAKMQSEFKSDRGYPDIFVAAPRGEYAGLYLELKKEGERIYLKDGSISKDKHVTEQHIVLTRLRTAGYCAEFAVGLDQAIGLVDWYLAGAEADLRLERNAETGEMRYTNLKSGEIF